MTESPGAQGEGTRTRGSIARRMLVTAAVWSLIIVLLAGWSLAALYKSETDRQLDSANDATILTLTNAVDTDDTGEVVPDYAKMPRDASYDRTLSGHYWAFLNVSSDNKIIGAITSLSFTKGQARPDPPPAMLVKTLADTSQAMHFDALGPDDKQLRIGLKAVKLPNRGVPIVLYTGVDRTSADAAVGRFSVLLSVALGVLALGIVVGVVVLIRFGLRPLHEIQEHLAEVRSGRRDRLVGEYPAELSPLVKEIDTLIVQNRKVVDRARTHVGNLAHALKTPLAVLMNESRGGTDRLSELVRRQADAMSQNVNHYLKRAQAAAQAEVLGARSDVKEAVEGIARMLERLHRDKGLTVMVDADERAIFRGDKADLDELVGNLLENAAKWCKSRVKVKVARLEDGVEVVVDDDGPGLPAEDRAKALQRGKRLDERTPGTGLGLSIVTELADIYGGHFYLEDSPMGGLRARLDLPAAPL